MYKIRITLLIEKQRKRGWGFFYSRIRPSRTHRLFRIEVCYAGFFGNLRIENLNKGLHVLIACPGFTASNIRNTALAKDGSTQGESPLDEGKLITSEDVAKHIISAIKKRKHRIVLTTQGKLMALLNKFFPKMMDKMVYNHMAKEHDSPFK